MTEDTGEIIETNHIIDGEWVPSAGGERYEVRNPARPDELVGLAASGDREDIGRACEAASRAFPAWSALSYGERAAYLMKVAENLVADEADVAARIRLFTREHGKILRESGAEISRLGDRFKITAGFAGRLATDDEIPGPPFDTIISRQPRGVAALIVPWNWPLSILGAKLPQALMAGNTAVIKLSFNSPLAPALTIRKIAEALPPGVVNLVTGPSSRTGDALLTHPLISKINFTGGVDTGKHVMKMAADRLTPVTLELGGNDAAIVLADAELDKEAFQRMVMGTFLTTGQVCMALKRLYVHRSRYDELVAGFTAGASRYVVGDGLKPNVTMGPLNNREQRDFVKELVDDARRAGATVQEVGTVDDDQIFEQGYFHRPTLVLDPDPELRVVREEQFGPVVPILPFDDEDEAVARANQSEFGLCSSVWSADRDRALGIARRLEAGYTYLNGHGPLAQDSRAPFGGFKHSGIGRNLGYEGVLEFQEYHSISAAPGWIF